MFPKIASWKQFVIRVSLICQLIISSISGEYKNRHLVSVDEKTGIQALERKEALMKTGQIKRQEYEYKRNGTTTLIAAQNVSNGEMVKIHLGQTRNEYDFLEFCKQTVAFLENQEHRIRFVFTPKHCSWLNPIENWFGKLQRHVITGTSFPSVQDLESKIIGYAKYYNKCMLKPLKWKFKGFTKGKVLECCSIVKT